MHCVFQSGPGEDSECSYQEEMIMVKMACMLITLIWSLHICTQTETSPPVPYFMSTKRKEKQERDQIYSTPKRKRKQHWDNHIGAWRDGQWLQSHAAPAEDRLVLSTHAKWLTTSCSSRGSFTLFWPPLATDSDAQTHRHVIFKKIEFLLLNLYIRRVSPICWWCVF